jgi:hypothetical protein
MNKGGNMKDDMKWKEMHMHHGMHGGSGAIYGLGVVGALVYYLQHAPTFQLALIGIGKAIAWPAFLVYKLIEVLKF